MRYLIWLLKVILIILCGICLLKMPYQYYVFFRYVSFTLFLIFCVEAFKRKHIYLGIVWGVSALMNSPFVKPVLGRTLWNTIDVIWIIIILGSMVADFRNIKRGEWR
ncbi:DUF6804 family protein [Chitinophaga sp. RAB17]|uniref:DUF6804 family protein n=1 Tax=Chitinophaga sp. RAB17 TaxID=3233049 RepID=UPI003F8EC2B1